MSAFVIAEFKVKKSEGKIKIMNNPEINEFKTNLIKVIWGTNGIFFGLIAQWMKQILKLENYDNIFKDKNNLDAWIRKKIIFYNPILEESCIQIIYVA